MKKLIKFIKSTAPGFASPGFTMIELLIVIAILGILAVAVLSAINPIEQINRGRDTGSRSDAEQFLSAIDRYNAFQGYYPWQTGANDLANMPITWSPIDGTVADNGGCPIDEKLSEATTAGCTGSDELKVTFFNRIQNATANRLYVYNAGGQGDSTYVCFLPKSKAFLTEAKERCVDAAGSGMPSDLEAAALTEICGGFDTDVVYICLP